MAKAGTKNWADTEVLEGQVALLRTGTRAALYACREVLHLSPGHNGTDVVRAVHNRIHEWNADAGPNGDLDKMLAALTAGKQLLAACLKG